MAMETMRERVAKLRAKTGCVSGATVQQPPPDTGSTRRHYSSSGTPESDTFGHSVQAVLQQPAVNDVSLAERLAKRVGYGDNPAKRKALFTRLQRLWLQHREAVEALVSEAWSQAAGARRRDRYFCRAICCKLAESGLELGRGAGGCTDAI